MFSIIAIVIILNIFKINYNSKYKMNLFILFGSLCSNLKQNKTNFSKINIYIILLRLFSKLLM
jgi:hypothetical protein